MRKITLILIAILTSLSSFAQIDEISIKSGDLKFLSEKSTASIEIKLDNATINEFENFKTWCGNDYSNRANLSMQAFRSAFNIASDDLKIGNNAQYSIVFNVKNIEQSLSTVEQGVAKSTKWVKNLGRRIANKEQVTEDKSRMIITGTIDITDLKNKKTICSLNIHRFNGTSEDRIEDRIAMLFGKLAIAIIEKK